MPYYNNSREGYFTTSDTVEIIQHLQSGNECFYKTIYSLLGIKPTYSLLYIKISLKAGTVQNFEDTHGKINTYIHTRTCLCL